MPTAISSTMSSVWRCICCTPGTGTGERFLLPKTIHEEPARLLDTSSAKLLGWRFLIEVRRPSVAGPAVPRRFGGPREAAKRGHPPKSPLEAGSAAVGGPEQDPAHCHPLETDGALSGSEDTRVPFLANFPS